MRLRQLRVHRRARPARTQAVGPRVSEPTAAVAVALAGVGVATVALAELVALRPSAGMLVGLTALLAGAILAERYPLPVEADGERGLTLTLVFGLASLVLFDWAAATVVFFVATATAHALEPAARRGAGRRAAAAAVSAACAGAVATLLDRLGAVDVAVTIGAAAGVYCATGAAIARLGADVAAPSRAPLRSRAAAAALPFALVVSTALALVVLWQRSPFYSLALAGPLVAIVLYGRSTHRAIGAMRLALTDPLTGLGNRRHFQERLRRELAAADGRKRAVSLCLLDVDDFKRVNDAAGHVAGDEVLVEVAARLRSGGEAFRLGGDEFAVLLPRTSGADAVAVAESIVRRIRTLRTAGERVTASAGVASFPTVEAHDVIRLADAALYRAKELGKDRVSAHGGETLELAGRRRTPLLGRTARHAVAAPAPAAE